MTENQAENGNAIQNAVLEEALLYASRGWHVFPCNPTNKAPLVGSDKDEHGSPIPKTGGLYKATIDVQQIREWWVRWPNVSVVR